MKFTKEHKIKNMVLKLRLFRIHTNFKIIENVKGRMVKSPQTFKIFCPVLPPLFGVTRFYGTAF